VNQGFIGALCLSVAFAMLAGCGALQLPIATSVAVQQTSAIATHAEHSKSWMLPSAKTGDLLYVSSSDGSVYVYRYLNRQLVGALSGFIKPLGECVDRSGNVFITAYSSVTETSSSIYEYAHGGSSPIATLSDPGHAFGCSIDPSTGNLAVANPYDPANPYNVAYGSVAIYQGASGSPAMYYPSDFGIAMCGYDTKGNLYVTVYGSQPGVAQLARLATNGSPSSCLASMRQSMVTVTSRPASNGMVSK